MTGREIGLGSCFVHRRVFEFDPRTVCTIWLAPAGTDPGGGTGRVQIVEPYTPGARQVPVCDPCMVKVNARREAMSLPPFQLSTEVPQPWEE
jgi:hypothetical protein